MKSDQESEISKIKINSLSYKYDKCYFLMTMKRKKITQFLFFKKIILLWAPLNLNNAVACIKLSTLLRAL